jgi:hypothetical protein
LLPDCLDDCIAEDNPIRVVDVFVEELRVQSSRRLEREAQPRSRVQDAERLPLNALTGAIGPIGALRGCEIGRVKRAVATLLVDD